MIVFNNSSSPGAIVSADPSATAWAAAVVANGGTVSTPRLMLVSTMIGGLKSDGVWTLLDRLWVFAAENTQSALTDMVGLTLGVPNISNPPIFTTDRGYQGPGAQGNVAGPYNPSTAINWSQNSGCQMCYVNSTGGTSNSGACETDAGFTTNMYPQYANNSLLGRINSVSYDFFAVGSALGSSVISRTASLLVTFYKNGSSIGTDTINTGGAPDNATNMLMCADHFGADSANRYAAFSFGGGLTAAQVSGNGRTTGLDGRILTYLTAIGAN